MPLAHTLAMIRKFIEKRKIKRVFEKLVNADPELLRAEAALPRHCHGRIEFIVIFVRGEDPEDVSRRISKVSDIAIAHGAMHHGIIGALVIVAFGTHPDPKLASKHPSRFSLVQSLQQGLVHDTKIVHGDADGHYGLFGFEQHVTYTFLVPKFDQVLGKLSQLEFGEAAEFPF